MESLRLSGFGVFQTVVECGAGEEGRQELDHLGFFGGHGQSPSFILHAMRSERRRGLSRVVTRYGFLL